MNRFFEKSKGTISVFLAIVLLPVLTVAAIFVDLSRKHLSEGVAYTAADLTLNTVLTQYDADLADIYGLVGSAQDVESLLASTKNYMVECMVSSGVTKEGAQITVDQIISTAFGSEDTVNDLLKLSFVESSEGGDGIVSPTASLNNPAIIKTQIVEFMKYRGPIEMVQSIFSKINNDTAAQTALDNVEAETKLLDERQAFYAAEAELISELIKLKKLMKEYDEIAKSQEWITSMAADVADMEAAAGGTFADVMKPVHVHFTQHMYNTYNFSQSSYIGEVSQKSLITEKSIYFPTQTTNYSESNLCSKDQWKSLILDYAKKMNDFLTIANQLKTKWENATQPSDSHNKTQYLVYLTDELSSTYNTYATRANALLQVAVNISNAASYLAEDANDQEVELLQSKYPNLHAAIDDDQPVTSFPIDQIYSELDAQYSDYILDPYIYSTSNAFSQIGNTVSNTRAACEDDIAGWYVVNGENEKVSYFFTKTQRLSFYHDELYAPYEKVTDIYTQLGTIKTLVETYNEAFTNWKTAAYSPELDDSEMALGTEDADGDKVIGDRELVTAIEEARSSAEGNFTMPENATVDDGKAIKQSGDLLRLVTAESLQTTYDRYYNIAILYNELRNGLRAPQYQNDRSILEITKLHFLWSASKIDASRIVLDKATLKSYAEESFSFSGTTGMKGLKFQEGDTLSVFDENSQYAGYNIGNKYHPQLTVETPDIYTWVLSYEFIEPNREDEDEDFAKSQEDFAKSQNEDIEGKSETDLDDIKAPESNRSSDSNNLNSLDGRPSAGLSGKNIAANTEGKSTDDAASQTASWDITGLVSQALTTGRDYLYTIEYVMNMFSYDTYDYEGMYGLLDDTTQGEVTPLNYSDKYSSVTEQWANTDVTFTANKSLTNQMINAENNYAFGNEVEYILYGGSNTANRTAAYASIFVLRYALDLVPVFREWYSDPAVESVAASLNALLLIPMPLTKTLICLALCAAEAAADINALGKGIPVPLYKTVNCDLYISFDAVFNGGSQRDVPVSTDVLSLQYSDYLTLFLFIGLLANHDLTYARIGDVIQANMEQARDLSGYRLSKAHVYYTLNATLQVEPLISIVPVFDSISAMSTMNNWRTYTVTMTRGYS